MKPEKIVHAIGFLTGEVHGLFMFCQAAAQLHPDKKALLSKLGEMHQRGLASIAPQPVPEATIEGFEFAMTGLTKALQAVAAD